MPALPSAPAEFHVASTWPHAIFGLARVAFAVALAWRKPTVMSVWQPWSTSRWMFAS